MIAVDTSVAVPLLLRTHPAHADVTRWWDGREIALAGHAVAETYSVLTRLGADARMAPADAATLISARFAESLTLSPRTWALLVETLAQAGVAGGATYDGIVALAAKEHDCVLATRDVRALATYRALGVSIEVVH